MVHLTLEALHRGFANHNQPQDADHLKKITHLQVSGRDIESVDSEALAACRSLTVVYLYDNRLENVPWFTSVNATNLTHIYIQNNAISRIEGISILKNLLKLFLGGNHLTVLEGLEQCSQLEELRVERQHLPAGHSLVFDPQTMAALANSLRIFDVSGNKLVSLVPLTPLTHLEELYAPANNIEEFRETGAMLEKSWRRLEILDLSGNPICHRNKYRERIIYLASPLLKQIDGKVVTDAQRRFVQGWHQAARGKHDEKVKVGSKISSSESKDGRFSGSTMRSIQKATLSSNEIQRQSDALMQGSNYVIPAMPVRNALKHQLSNKNPRGLSSTTATHSSGFRGFDGSGIAHELSRQLDQNTSLSSNVM